MIYRQTNGDQEFSCKDISLLNESFRGCLRERQLQSLKESPQRCIEASVLQTTDQILSLIGQYGYLIIFFGVMLESVGVPLPGETILITAGYLVHQGTLDPGDAIASGILGTIVGNQIGYWVGREGDVRSSYAGAATLGSPPNASCEWRGSLPATVGRLSSWPASFQGSGPSGPWVASRQS